MNESTASTPHSATPRLIAATIDCVDLDAMATFWSALLAIDIRGIQGGFGFLGSPGGTGISLWLQEVPEPRAGKTRLHLDLAATDLAATLDRVRELGGTVGERHEWHGYVWHQCFDPEGNVFDVMQSPETTESDPDS